MSYSMPEEYEDAIAIIGMAGRFPGANNIDVFWKNLCDGVASITFFSDEELLATGVEETLSSHPDFVKAGAVLSDIEYFDAAFFGFSPKEARTMDPQHRFFLECAWEALENAGLDPSTYPGPIGIVAGASRSHYLLLKLHHALTTAKELEALKILIGNEKDYLATKVSYKFKLTGPSLTVQTACSTSLVAVHLACQSLLNGECDVALAGGITIRLPQAGYLHEEGGISSPDGYCRPFDAKAQGTLGGNGVGVVVLKRLDEALADGDCIDAIIRGSAINNDGSLKVGYTAPSQQGQAKVITEALRVANLEPTSISYIETHGTGTALGDPIEIAALTQAFAGRTSPCAIGAVKSNIGHLESAAGVVGLIKTVLALKHKLLPPTLHFERPNPQIDFANNPFYVQTTLTEWKSNGSPRRAGVSSFGIGGTNAHVVLEEAPARSPQSVQAEVDRPLHLLCLSAKSENALTELVSRYEKHLAEPLFDKLRVAQLEIANVCFTANSGRSHFAHRLSVIAQSRNQVIDALQAFSHGQEAKEIAKGRAQNASVRQTQGAPPIAFLFTGQGSQYVGMGRGLYETQPTFRNVLQHCDDFLRAGGYLPRPLLEVLYPKAGVSSLIPIGHAIDETGYTQVALFALEYALAKLWQSWGIKPSFVMGHSVGEIVAACVAGVFSLDDGLKLVAERGRLMQSTKFGQMVAVMASEAEVRNTIVGTTVAIAAINGPKHVVISGDPQAVARVVMQLQRQGINSKKLNVSHAFHSPQMRPIIKKFLEIAQQIQYLEPQIPLLSNVTGAFVGTEVASAQYWARHIISPVRFYDGIKTLRKHTPVVDIFVEVGPMPILLGMGRRIYDSEVTGRLAQSGTWLPSLRPDKEWHSLLTTLSELYVRGVEVDWVGFDQDYPRRKVVLPTYPFQRERYWLENVEPSPRRSDTSLLAFTPTKGLATDGRKSVQGRHPLLGQRVSSALAFKNQNILFTSKISKTSPAYLAEHRVFGQAILPATGYLEIALAAGAEVLSPRATLTQHASITHQVVLERVLISQAMKLHDKPLTVQLLLTALPSEEDLKNKHNESKEYFFEIFSQSTEGRAGEENWVRHATGQVVVADRLKNLEPFGKETSNEGLATLQARCRKQIALGKYYQQFVKLGIEHGPQFRALEVLFGGSGEALGRIRLPNSLETSTSEYQLHPVILDACLQVAPAAIPRMNEESYLPVAVERLTLYGPFNNCLWSHASLRETSDSTTLMADLHLFSEEGQLVAVVTGLQLKRTTRQAVLGKEPWQDWFYEVAWHPQVRYGLLPEEFKSPREMVKAVEPMLHQPQPELEEYLQDLEFLSQFSLAYIGQALQQLGFRFQVGVRFSTSQLAQQLGIINPYQRLLARLLEILAEEGFLSQLPTFRQAQGSTSQLTKQWKVIAEWREQLWDEKVEIAQGELTLLTRCGKQLANVLRGAKEPLQLLFPEADLETAAAIYRDSPNAVLHNRLIQQLFSQALDLMPIKQGVRILEIGAGTGGTTAHLLPHLPAERTDYVFTDISPLFLSRAEEKFKDYSFVHYKLLNIEQDIIEQGFIPHQYDFVIAANVLHATKDLRETLEHVRHLLAPGGLLILLEATARQRWVDLTFGLTDGWWRFRDMTLRPDYPLLNTNQWKELLSSLAFNEVVSLPPNTSSQASYQTIIVAQTKKDTQVLGHPWLIFADSKGVGQELAALLLQKGERPFLVWPGNEYEEIRPYHVPLHVQRTKRWIQQVKINPLSPLDYERLFETLVSRGEAVDSYYNIVHLWTADAPIPQMTNQLERANELGCGSMLYLVQALIKNVTESRLWLVTCGAQAPSSFDQMLGVAQSAIAGMGKVIALEHPELHCVHVDLEPDADQNAQHLFEEVWSETRNDRQEFETQIALRDGERRVARLVKAFRQDEQLVRLGISSRGTLDNLVFKPMTRREPSVGEIEIRVHATGLSFLDVLDVLGMAPFEQEGLGGDCAGKVVAIGQGVKGFNIGDDVVGIAIGSFSQYVTTRAEMMVHKPVWLTFEQAAAIPSNFLTAYYALHHLGHISKGDRVLIHAAAGGTGMAAVQIAIRAGAEVFGTASPSKWHVLKEMGISHIYNSRTLDFAAQIMQDTNGKGVDIVLNSLTSEGFIAKSLSVLSSQGCFLEMAGLNVWSPKEVAQVKPNVSYHLINLTVLVSQQAVFMKTMLHELMQQFAPKASATQHLFDRTLKPLPCQLFPFQEAVSAFRYMQQAKHIGKIVITVPPVAPLVHHPSFPFRSDSSYLITGGLQGLGLLVARWMVKHGARHLVLMARSKPTQKVNDQLRELEQVGADVVVVQVDVSQKKQLEKVLLNISPPLRGIIHSAGVLDDGVLQQQSWPRFTKVFAPKVQGAWHLHELTTDVPLDFFVLFSSTASLLGSPGQANHAAANAFLDALARFRYAIGLPALSINWGAWSEVGAAARHKVGEPFRKRGGGFISPQQGLDVLEQLLKEPPSQAVMGIMPIDWSEFKSDLPFLRNLQMVEADAVSVASQRALPPRFAQQLELAAPSTRRSLLETHVREELVKVLGFAEPSHISLSQGLFDMGMDSLTSIELRNRLQTSLASQLPSTLVMDYPTLESLVDYLAVEVFGTEVPVPQEVEVADVISISDDIASLLAAELMAIEEDKV